MATNTPTVIQNFQKDLAAGWDRKLFFGDPILRDKFVSWLKDKDMGKSDEQREQFLWAVQHNLEPVKYWTSDSQQSIKDNISEAKDRFDSLSSLAIDLSRCLSAISRLHSAQLELKRALASQENQDQFSFLLREGPAYYNQLAKAAAIAKSSLTAAKSRVFFDDLVSYIGAAWQLHLKEPPSASDTGKFRQFIFELNKEIGTCLPTSSASLRRALKQ